MARAVSTIAALVLVIQPALLFADGGTLRLSQKSGELQVSAFTSPEVLRCGPIDISVMVQDAATGKVRDDVPVKIRLEKTDAAPTGESSAVVEQVASTEAATNKLFQAASFDIPSAGTWRATIALASDTQQTSGGAGAQNLSGIPASQLTFDLAVAPPLPPWLELAPWIGWPFVVVALFLMHQWLKSAASRSMLRAKTCKLVSAS